MYDNKNNNKISSSNQRDVTQDVNIEKLTGDILSNFINEHNFSGFTIMSNATINLLKYDCALAVYCYLACKPNDWIINVENIKNHFNMGKEKAYKIVNYLIEFGLMERKDIRENGKHKETIYYLYISPKRHAENQVAENQVAEKPPHTKKRINKEKNINTLNNNVVSSKNRYSEAFESFWNFTNKRGEKIKAFSSWRAHKLDSKADEMISLLEKNYQRKYGDKEPRYQPHISTWINYEPWEEGEAKTEEEIIAKAHEQIQATKDNLPKKIAGAEIKNREPIASDSKRLQDHLIHLGVFIPFHLLEAFILGLKGRNIDTSDFNLQLIAKEVIKIKENGLNIERCIEKFLMSSWKSFSVDYFSREDVKKDKGSWFDDPYAPHNLL